MQQVMNRIFGPEVQVIDLHLPNWDFFDNMVSVPSSKVLSLLLAAIIAASVVIFKEKIADRSGNSRNSARPRAARVLGINTDQIYAITFAFNSAICGAAGVLVSIIWVIQPFYGIYSVRSLLL